MILSSFQVLLLVFTLARAGHYGQAEEVKFLLEPLLSLLDGRNDVPYPTTNGKYQLRYSRASL